MYRGRKDLARKAIGINYGGARSCLVVKCNGSLDMQVGGLAGLCCILDNGEGYQGEV